MILTKEKYPKISIVTPSYNQGSFIEQTILSIINQDYPNLEYIIIDGGSTDSTLDIIKKYEKHITYWVSEKDNGQANAINKGISLCTGEIFNWINSDDYLAEGALFTIANQWNQNIDILLGNVVNFLGEKEYQFAQRNINFQDMLLGKAKFHQPGAWCRLASLKKMLPFREDYHYCFDGELFIRWMMLKPRVKVIDDNLVYFRLHDYSKTYGSPEKMRNEFNKIRSTFLKNHVVVRRKFRRELKLKTLSKVLSLYCSKRIVPSNKFLFLLTLLKTEYFTPTKFYISCLFKSLKP